jgi:hypothetical protein
MELVVPLGSLTLPKTARQTKWQQPSKLLVLQERWPVAKRYIVSAYKKQIDKAVEHIQYAQQIGTDIGVLQYHLQEALKALSTSVPLASETKAQREKEAELAKS